MLVAFLLALSPLPARAEFTLAAGLEYFHWQESSTPSVTESGPRAFGELAYTMDRDSGLLFAYRGRLYAGVVDYDGALLISGTPVTSTTSYFGMSNEGQGRFRFRLRQTGYADLVTAVGVDAWRRELSADQREDYTIGFARLGLEAGSLAARGWVIGGGVKYPFYRRENAHLDDIGATSNPTLEPGASVSFYARLEYAITEHWRITAYYDSFRFDQSPLVSTTAPAFGPGTIQFFQPKSSLDVYGVGALYRF
jgi:hypothetical protein